MDPIEKMLIEKYKIPPKEAKAYAAKLAAGTEPEDGLKTEAYNDVAKNEVIRMRQMKLKLERYAELSAKKNSADPNLSPGDEAFYQSVRKHHDEAIRAKAHASAQGRSPGVGPAQIPPSAEMGAVGPRPAPAPAPPAPAPQYSMDVQVEDAPQPWPGYSFQNYQAWGTGPTRAPYTTQDGITPSSEADGARAAQQPGMGQGDFDFFGRQMKNADPRVQALLLQTLKQRQGQR